MSESFMEIYGLKFCLMTQQHLNY
ncbi:hypothetical protein TRIP_B180018 [uncultured Desulfatiglans sp.]|uniref:Uncharacterized protein n=1 Tax=Uncultured Desulfatiglans sp. TaxID=1748965 RepID=A0A653A1B2_UNCDX|nr:hypothetical protein TRIP_B180018 [uncultured Desulfatiglans sp.]